MNVSLYNEIKDAIRNGQSLDDIMAAFDTAQKDIEAEKPKTPIADHVTNPQTVCSCLDDIDQNALRDSSVAIATLMAGWMVQMGLAPDDLYDSIPEFINKIQERMVADLEAFKFAAKITKMKNDGVGEGQIIKYTLDSIGEDIRRALMS